MSLPLTASPGRITRLTAQRKDTTTAELNFNAVEGATHYVIHREVGMKTVKLLLSVSFTTNQTRFIDRSIDSSHAHTYTSVKAMLGETVQHLFLMLLQFPPFSELMDDRDSRIQVWRCLWRLVWLRTLWRNRKYADISNGNYSDKGATATIPFNGPGIEIYGLKSSQLGLAEVTIGWQIGWRTWVSIQLELWKGVLIGRYTNLSSGPHLMTITVKREQRTREVNAQKFP